MQQALSLWSACFFCISALIDGLIVGVKPSGSHYLINISIIFIGAGIYHRYLLSQGKPEGSISMLRSVNEIKNYVLEAIEGDIGRCKDFLFDDARWTIRYMVADTRKWLPGRKVLISPESLAQPDWFRKRFPIPLSRQQIKESPPLETDEPVSRQYETRWREYYGLPRYWLGPGGTGAIYSPMVPSAENQEAQLEEEMASANGHLRSAQEVIGYHIQALDGEIGHVEDFLVDDLCWTLNYIVVDTRNWLPGRRVLVPPQWTDTVSWAERKVIFKLNKEKVKNSPEYDPAEIPNRHYEELLCNYYGTHPYRKKS